MTIVLPFAAAHPIVHVNAALNITAAVLLVLGYILIRRRRETAHMWVMLAAFDFSIAFLVCYLWYHATQKEVRFTHPGVIRHVYLAVLFTHIPLAFSVPFLASATIYLGFRATGCCTAADARPDAVANFRRKHRQLARWTLPIWLYVSVTGVVVYLMLYHLWPPAGL